MIAQTRLLLVESNRFHCRLLAEALSGSLGSIVLRSATSAESAARELRHNRFDLALLDLRTLRNDTAALLKQLQNTGCGIPAVVMASEVDTHLALEAVNDGASAVLLKKPDFQASAAQLIRSVLARTRIVADIGDTGQSTGGSVDLVKVTVGTLAHEINNPLMTILGNAELGLSGSSKYDHDTMEKMTAIHRSATRIADTLEHVARMKDPVIKRTISGPLLDLAHTPTTSQS